MAIIGAIGTTQTSSAAVATTPVAVTVLTPDTGAVSDPVVITGSGFFSVTSVKFNGTAATSYTIPSNTEINAVVPAGTTTGTVTVSAEGGTATGPVFTIAP